MKALPLLSIIVLFFISCGQDNKPSEQATVAQTQVVQNIAPSAPTNGIKDIIKILKDAGIKFQTIQPDKEIRISVSKTLNSKFSDWTPAKVYSYLSGDDFNTVSEAINNNADGGFHYNTSKIAFNVSNSTMNGGTYSIVER